MVRILSQMQYFTPIIRHFKVVPEGHEGVLGSGDIAPRIDLGTRWK